MVQTLVRWLHCAKDWSGSRRNRSVPEEEPHQSLQPRDWLLMLIGGADEPLDRVRIQKAMFLFAEGSKAAPEEKYIFTPYHYGPFSFDIYPDLDRLVSQGLVRAQLAQGMNSPSYVATAAGRERAAELRRGAPDKRVQFLSRLREYVTGMDFGTLLRAIYRRFPHYATRSVFR